MLVDILIGYIMLGIHIGYIMLSIVGEYYIMIYELQDLDSPGSKS